MRGRFQVRRKGVKRMQEFEYRLEKEVIKLDSLERA